MTRASVKATITTPAGSIFLRDGDTVLHTWSGYGPVSYLLCETDILLDLTPLGRQDEDIELHHHDKYPEDGHDRQSD